MQDQRTQEDSENISLSVHFVSIFHGISIQLNSKTISPLNQTTEPFGGPVSRLGHFELKDLNTVIDDFSKKELGTCSKVFRES